MTIPEKVKIGGKEYEVLITDNLSSGSSNCCGEIDYVRQQIKLLPSSKDNMEITLLHEIVHASMCFLGKTDHDEETVDLIANIAQMLIKDNKDMFACEDMKGAKNE